MCVTFTSVYHHISMFTNYIINANKTRMTMTTTIKSEDLISDGITNEHFKVSELDYRDSLLEIIYFVVKTIE